MRRSAAPSQANAGIKRAKFTAPATVVQNFSKERVADDLQSQSIKGSVPFKQDTRQINSSLYKNVIKNNDSQKSRFSFGAKIATNSPPPVNNVSGSGNKCEDFGAANISSVSVTENNRNGLNSNLASEREQPRRDLSAILSLTKATFAKTDCPNDDEEFASCEEALGLEALSCPTYDQPSERSLPLQEAAASPQPDSPLVSESSLGVSGGDRVPLEEQQINGAKSQLTSRNPVSRVSLDASAKQSSEETATNYFSVVWCKLSKKKHKKWEGDAVLTTKGRSATLYDMEGKIIGRGTGYKIAQLENLAEDETLMIGGKEIQVMSVLAESHFKSGKCFSVAGCCTDTSQAQSNGSTSKPGSFKPFINPVKNGKGMLPCRPIDGGECEGSNASLLRHDPTAPNALVLPRPTSDHQWRHNKAGLPVLDVVVDPYLSHFLRSHQRTGVVFLYECIMGMRDFQGQGAILADDMGLGKTLQCISLIWTVLKQGPYGGKPIAKKILIITPGSLVTNWFMEFKKWLGLERLNVFAASGDKRVEEFVKLNVHPVLIVSYEMMVRCFDALKDVRFDLIVCDEGHRLKNTAIKTTSMISSLPTRRRVVLTGTPVQNDLQEFFSIVEFCNPGFLGSSGAFKRVYEDPIILSRQPSATAAQKDLGKERAQELTRLTQMFVLRRTQEINNQYLPPKVELVLFCRPSPLQLSLYRQLICSQVLRRCLTGNLSGAPHLICIGALKEVCNHPQLLYRKAQEVEARKGRDEDVEDSIYSNLLHLFPSTHDPGSANVADSGKLEVLAGILSSIWEVSSLEKVVLVANHTKTLDILQVFCEGQGYGCLRLDGQTPTAQRQDLVNRFNNRHFTSHRIFLLSSKAGGVGLNLVGASRLILYDIDWNPANDLQAMARVWRDGQKGKVHIYRLLTTGSIEEKIYQRQISKQGLSGAIMDLHNKNNVQFSVDDLKNLFSVNEKTDCETHSMLSCECGGDPDYLPPPPQPTPLDNQRSCQLGQHASASGNEKKKGGKSKNLTMAELFQWKHWQGQFGKTATTWLLDQVGPVLSFLFWHETNVQNHTDTV